MKYWRSWQTWVEMRRLPLASLVVITLIAIMISMLKNVIRTRYLFLAMFWPEMLFYILATACTIRWVATCSSRGPCWVRNRAMSDASADTFMISRLLLTLISLSWGTWKFMNTTKLM